MCMIKARVSEHYRSAARSSSHQDRFEQEIWMHRHAAALDGAVLVGVGAAMDIIAGRFREAPLWMTNHGLEWIFKLAQEPHRLSRRYLIDDPWILAWAARARLERMFHRGRSTPGKPAAR